LKVFILSPPVNLKSYNFNIDSEPSSVTCLISHPYSTTKFPNARGSTIIIFKILFCHHCLPSRRPIFLVWLSYVQGDTILRHRTCQLVVPSNKIIGGILRIIMQSLESFLLAREVHTVPFCHQSLCCWSTLVQSPSWFC
jgi:hypothetical protein